MEVPKDVQDRLERLQAMLRTAEARLRPSGEALSMRLDMVATDLDYAAEEVKRLILRLQN